MQAPAGVAILLLLLLPFASILNLARCASIAAGGRRRIVKRFVLHGQRWTRCRLSWAFRDPFGLFSSEQQFDRAKRAIADAMTQWERAARHLGLRLTDLSPASRRSSLNARRVADIDILFAAFGHGDAENFDGPGGLVAHSAYPPLGIVHFDASESWSLDGAAIEQESRSETNQVADGQQQQQQTQLDLRYVALHEIGHALGLRHSTFRNSVMNCYYSRQKRGGGGGRRIIQLSKDDIAALEELFAEKCGHTERGGNG